MRKQARRERNYQKLSDFQNRIRSVLITNMEDKMSQLWNIYQDAIVEFENTDDMYHDKAAFYYDMWSDFGDGLTDLWRGTKDVLRGAVDAVTELGEGLVVLAMWSSPAVRVGQLFGMLPEYAEEKVAEMDAGILQLLQDPVNTLGAIEQNMADTVDEEGLAYGISYVAADVAVEILLEKGLGKVMEGGSNLDDVTAHMDDAAAGAGKYADDVAVVEKHVDDVGLVEGGSYSRLEDGLNFSDKALEHMGENGRSVPVQTLQDAIRYGEALPDPRGSSATMYYNTMYKNANKYNLEVLYQNKTNTVYHFEYARRAMGNLPAIKK